jgi:hypothetical protein
MGDNPIVFEEQGHPTIKVFEDRISIKSKDFSTFRDFKLDTIKWLKFYRPGDTSFFGLLFWSHPFWRKYLEKDDFILRVKLKDGNYWDYETTYKYNPSFKVLIENLQAKLMGNS